MGKEYLQNSSVFEAAICVTVHIHALNINANSLLICSLWLCHIDLSTAILACISKAQFGAVSKWKKQGKYHCELHDDVNTLEPDGYEQVAETFPDVYYCLVTRLYKARQPSGEEWGREIFWHSARTTGVMKEFYPVYIFSYINFPMLRFKSNWPNNFRLAIQLL